MKKLNKDLVPLSQKLPVKIIQFGEGNFMRAFADWQVQKMLQMNLFQGKVTIVQPIEKGLGELLKEQDYLYTVILQGLLNNEIIDNSEIIEVVDDVINPYQDWEKYLSLAEDDNIEFIISNTTEAGIQYNSEDKLADTPPKSFPAKLAALLYQRYQLGKRGLTIIPCELIDRNGEKLKEIIVQYAIDWSLGADFINWLEKENIFCCSLVDRIVPGYPRENALEFNQRHGYEDKLMVKAEPFMLWVIEGPSALSEKLPLTQAGLNVIFTDNMTPYRERKVHLLNGPHTAMVPLAMSAGLETVEDVMTDSDFREFIDNLFKNELIPMLDLPRSELNEYAEQIKERFLNPFAHHELSAISLNSVSKFKARLLPILLRYQASLNSLPPYITLSLASLILNYRGDILEIKDDDSIQNTFKTAWQKPDTVVQTILADTKLWGEDLSQIPNLTKKISDYLKILEKDGARLSIQKINKGVIQHD